MATGDVAAAAGLPVVPSTKDIRQGYDDINTLADKVGEHLLSGGHTWARITGKPTTFPPSTHNHDDRYYTKAQVNDILELADAVNVVVHVVDSNTGEATVDWPKGPFTNTPFATASIASTTTQYAIASCSPTDTDVTVRVRRIDGNNDTDDLNVHIIALRG